MKFEVLKDKLGPFRGYVPESDLKKLWDFIKSEKKRIEVCVDVKRPPIMSLEKGLNEKFGELISENKVKRLVGAIVKIQLEEWGYSIERKFVRFKGDIFSSGTLYSKTDRKNK